MLAGADSGVAIDRSSAASARAQSREAEQAYVERSKRISDEARRLWELHGQQIMDAMTAIMTPEEREIYDAQTPEHVVSLVGEFERHFLQATSTFGSNLSHRYRPIFSSESGLHTTFTPDATTGDAGIFSAPE